MARQSAYTWAGSRMSVCRRQQLVIGRS